MNRLACLIALGALTLQNSCGENPGTGNPAAASLLTRSAAARQTPEQVADGFLQAVQRHDEAGFLKLLTAKAAAALSSDNGGLSVGDNPLESYTLGATTQDGNTASVEVTGIQDGKPQTVRLKMRDDTGSWRIFAMAMVMGEGAEFTIDFEALGSMFGVIEEELKAGFEEAFSELQAEQEVKAEQKIERDRELFEALEALSLEEWESSWRVALERSGQSAREALDALVPGNDAPVTWAGPFLISVENIEENVPHATGSLQVVVRARDLAAPIVSQLSKMNELLRVTAITHQEEGNLNANEGTTFLGTPTFEDGILTDTTRLGLRNLLRKVTEVDRVAGHVSLAIPVAVQAVSFDQLVVGEQRTVGAYTLELKRAGTYCQFELRGPSEALKNLEIRFSARGSDGQPLGEEFSDSMAFGEQLRASIQTEVPPTFLDLKIVSVESVEYPFEILDIPLSHHAEMPEQLETLAFEGAAAPVTVRFESFQERDTDFPKARLQLVSHCNKDARVVQVTFLYLDAAGQTLKEFPHTLNGTFTFEGHEPVVSSQQTTTQDATAFFMPEETATLRLQVDGVEFFDGTSWQPE